MLTNMNLHTILVQAGHGALSGVMPAIGIDIHTVYQWTQQDTKSFWQMYDWRISLKRIIAGVISGAFGNTVVGQLFGVSF